MNKDTTAPTTRIIPPYLPFKTFDNTITGWKVVLPNRIDRSLLGTYAGTMQGLLLSALKYFGLIGEDGVPQDSLRRLVAAEGAEREKELVQLTRRGYPFLFHDGFDLEKTTPQQLREKFESTGASGATLVKCISFFTAIAKAAGMPGSPFVKTRTRRANGRKAIAKKLKTPAPAMQDPGDGHREQAPLKTPFQVLFDLLDVEDMEDDEQQAVWTLLRYIKKQGGTQ